MYIEPCHPLTHSRKKTLRMLLRNTSSTSSTLGKTHDLIEMQQYTHGLAWHLYGAYVTTKFVMTCSCMPSISRGDNLFNYPFPTKVSLTSASSSFASQIWHLVCGYSAKYYVQNPNASSYM